MRKFKKLLVTIVTLSAIIMFTGCQDQPNPVEPFQDSNQPGLSKFSLPADATFQSATLNIYVIIPTGQDINLHRVTSPWEEMVVTWNNFGGAYAPEVEGSFNAAAAGWYSVDVTSLVGSWLDGTNTNYGLLLDQVDIAFPRTRYGSREWTYKPYLEICYTGVETVCEEIETFGDTYIHERSLDVNNGAVQMLNTGWYNDSDLEMQALIMFDIEPTVVVECTRTPIYWKRHTQYGPGTRDSNWDLILPSGEDTEFFLSEKSYYEVLQRPPFGNAYYRLARQYIAAELNVLSGASIPAEVQAKFDAATVLFNTYTPAEVRSWRFFHPIRRQFRSIAFILHKYNWGIIGPGRCGQ